MAITPVHLTDLGFRETKIRIQVINNRLCYLANIAEDIEDLRMPGVYLIVAKPAGSQDSLTVLYVGKAGGGVNRRLCQHQAGYQRKIRTSPEVRDHRLENALNKRNVGEALVWFRPSRVVSFADITTIAGLCEIAVSQFSLEEEAFILYFQYKGEPLINSSLPSRQPCAVSGKTRINMPPTQSSEEALIHQTSDLIDGLTKELAINSPDQIENWNQSIAVWDTETKNNFFQVLTRLQGHTLIRRRSPKIIGAYNSGPFRNQPILVFGKLARAGGNFSRDTNQLIFTLDGQYIAMYPFNPKRIIVQTLADFLEL